MTEYKKPPQEQAKAGKQMVKNKSVSDLVYDLLLICLRENTKGQIHRRVSMTQIIFSNLPPDAVPQGWHRLDLLNPCSGTLIITVPLSRPAALNSFSINLQSGFKF